MKKEIGYWKRRKDESSDLPWPVAGSNTLSTEDTAKILEFLHNGSLHVAWRGFSTCRICGKENGSTCLTNGNFVYPTGYAHYIETHNVAPDLDLVAEVLS